MLKRRRSSARAHSALPANAAKRRAERAAAVSSANAAKCLAERPAISRRSPAEVRRRGPRRPPELAVIVDQA
eukprot:14715507-Alexandrium_andersonii.AAC.1